MIKFADANGKENISVDNEDNANLDKLVGMSSKQEKARNLNQNTISF